MKGGSKERKSVAPLGAPQELHLTVGLGSVDQGAEAMSLVAPPSLLCPVKETLGSGCIVTYYNLNLSHTHTHINDTFHWKFRYIISSKC